MIVGRENPHTSGDIVSGRLVMSCAVCGPAADERPALPRRRRDRLPAVVALATAFDERHAHRRQPQDRPWSEYPLGTLAHACTGGAWLRIAGGWQWNGHRPHPGGTFPTPGGDAVGACIELPAAPAQTTEA